MTSKKDASQAGGPSALSGAKAGPISSYGAAYLLRDPGRLYEAMDCLEWQARALAGRLEELKEMAFGASNSVLDDIAQGHGDGLPSEPWPTGEEGQIRAEAKPRRGRATAREAVLTEEEKAAKAAAQADQRIARHLENKAKREG